MVFEIEGPISVAAKRAYPDIGSSEVTITYGGNQLTLLE